MKTSLLVILSLLSLSFSAFTAEKANTNSKVSAPINQQIDLNKADSKAIAKSIKGIGPKRAEAIVQYRDKNGPFKTIKDLSQVKGLGKSFVKKNQSELEKIFKIN